MLFTSGSTTTGISVDKSSSSFLMVAGFISGDGSMSQDDIADYVSATIKDPLSRVTEVGIGERSCWYTMRDAYWLDPDKLVKYNMTTLDVDNRLNRKITKWRLDQLNCYATSAGQRLNVSIIAQTRLNTPEQFADILMKVNQDGSRV